MDGWIIVRKIFNILKTKLVNYTPLRFNCSSTNGICISPTFEFLTSNSYLCSVLWCIVLLSITFYHLILCTCINMWQWILWHNNTNMPYHILHIVWTGCHCIHVSKKGRWGLAVLNLRNAFRQIPYYAK